MSPRLYALIAGGLLVISGLIALVFAVTIPADSIVIDSVECGNGFGMVDKAPIGAPDDWRTQCDSAVSGRQTLGWVLVGVGVLVSVGSLAIRTAGREEPAAS
jgi:hypothetical protein